MAAAKRALFPGSFDPPTKGHIDLLLRALGMYDEVVVGILDNPAKSAFFSIDERKQFFLQEFPAEPRLRVLSFSGLLVDFAREQAITVVLRGLRSISDFEYEAQMAYANRTLHASLDTVFLLASEGSIFISSTLVKQVAQLGGDVSQFVPPSVATALAARCSGGE